MKIILTFLIFSTLSVFAKIDTLSNWNKNSQNISGYNAQWSFARFDIDRPTKVKSIRAYFIGSGTAQVVLLGHNAGSFLPEVFAGTNGAKYEALWQNVSINVQQGQLQAVDFSLEGNEVDFENNQFFIGVNCSQGLYLATDGTVQSPTCESSNGGTYLSQQLITSDGWSLGNQGFLVDVVVEQSDDIENKLFRIVNEERGLPLNLSSQGISWADIDGNGFQDLVAQGKIYYNENGDFTSYDLGAGSSSHQLILDMDNDGDLDIILLRISGNKSVLMLNDGEGNFEQKNINIPDLTGITSASVMDLNKDGFPDIFLGQLWNGYPIAQANFLLYNDGNLNFIDKTKELYPEHNGYYNFPNGDSVYSSQQGGIVAYSKNSHSRGSQFVDFDEDGDYDLYITNYFLGEDELYENLGNGNWRNIISDKQIDQNAYTSNGQTVRGHNHGTGVDWYDYDNDGDMDLLLSQFAHPRFLQYDHRGTTIYNNDGAPYYDLLDTYNADRWESSLGFEFEETHAGAAWGDFNNDGLADFIITTFYGCRYIDLYMQKEDGTFENKSWEAGIEKTVTGVDANWVDYDNDGDLDLCVGENGQFRLRENNGNGNSWLEIDLEAVDINKFALGAKVKVFAGGKTYYQQVSNMRGQNMQRPYRLHFGLNNEEIVDKIIVEWEKGDAEEFYNIEANQMITLLQGTGTLSVKNLENNIKLYPNPINDKGTLEINFDDYKSINISLYDLLGNKINDIYSGKAKNYVTTIDSKTLESGIYLIKIDIAGDIITKKFTVVK